MHNYVAQTDNFALFNFRMTVPKIIGQSSYSFTNDYHFLKHCALALLIVQKFIKPRPIHKTFNSVSCFNDVGQIQLNFAHKLFWRWIGCPHEL